MLCFDKFVFQSSLIESKHCDIINASNYRPIAVSFTMSMVPENPIPIKNQPHDETSSYHFGV